MKMITFTDGQKVYSISDSQHLAIIYVTYIETNDTIVFCYCCTYVLRRCVCVFWTVVSFELKGTMGKLKDQMFLLFDVYKCKCVFGVFSFFLIYIGSTIFSYPNITRRSSDKLAVHCTVIKYRTYLPTYILWNFFSRTDSFIFFKIACLLNCAY